MSSNISVVDKSLRFKFVLKNEHKAMDQATEQMQISYERYKQHVDSQNAEVINESECLKMEKNLLNKKTVFIFEEFSGTAFDYVKASKALLLGPRCLTSCLVDDLTIPFITSPVMNLAMRGMIVTASGMTIKEKERIKELVNYMGAQYLDTLTLHCTHLIANTVRSVKYEKAGACHMKIMHPDWLQKVFERSQTETILASSDEFLKYKLPIFFTLNFTSTNLLLETKNKVKKAIEANGGQYMGSFKSEVTDMLILDKDKTNSEKFSAAIRYNKDCLTPQWVFDSVEKQYALPISNYRVAMMKVSTPTKTGVSNASAFNPDCTQLSEISHGPVAPGIRTINETVVSVASSSISAMEAPKMSLRRNDAQTQPAYKAVMQRLNVQMAKKAGPFLDGCNIYLCGFSNDDKDVLNKILNNGGATRFDEIDERVSHVIVGETVDANFAEMKKQNLNPALVNLQWLEACISAKQPVNEDEFLIKEKVNVEKEPEQPSPASKKNLQSMNHSFKRPAIPKFNLDDQAPAPDQHTSAASANEPSHQDDLMMGYLNGGAVAVPAEHAAGSSGGTSMLNSEAYTEEFEDINFFQGKIVYIEGFPEEDHQTLITDCEGAGGQLVDENYKDTIDYVIVPNIGMEGVMVKKYRNLVNDLWLEEAIRTNKCVEMKYYYSPIFATENCKPLNDLNIVISTYTGSERFYLMNLGQSLGANVKEQYIKKQKPLLLCSTAEGAKYQAALKWKLPIVTADWVLECYKQKKLVELAPFVVGESCTNIPNQTVVNKSVENSSTVSNIEKIDNDTTARHQKEAISTDIGTTTRHQKASAATAIETTTRQQKNATSTTIETTTRDQEKATTTDKERAYIHQLMEEDEAFSQKLQERREKDAELDIPAGASSLRTSTPVLRNKRLSELNPRTPQTPITPPPAASNISALVQTFPTPNREVLYKALKEMESKETPQTKRYKRLMATPGSDEQTTPTFPPELKTPDTPWGFRPDASPRNHMYHKRQIEAMDIYYRPPAAKTSDKPETPTLAQVKKRFWQDALGDDYVDYEAMAGAPDTEVDTESVRVPTPGAKAPQKKMRPEQPPAAPQNPPEIEEPHVAPTTSDTAAPTKIGSNVRVLTEFIKNMKDTSIYEKITNNYEDSEPQRLDSQFVTGQTDSNMIGWRDPTEFRNARKFRKSKSQCLTQPIFAFSSTQDETREKLIPMLRALKGEMFEGQYYDARCTHILCDKPSRGEKIFTGIAAGKWVLSTKYIEDSADAEQFLDEEEYEWGNPKAVGLPQLKEANEQNIANAAFRWRTKISNEPGLSRGVFSNFRVILVVMKHEQFARLLKAGGGVILDVSPPYEGCSEALSATHCFVDQKKTKLSKTDHKTLMDAKIPVMSIMYLNSYLTSEVSEPTKYLMTID